MEWLLDSEERKSREELIAKEYDGIYPVFEAFYFQSVLYAAERASAAFERYDSASNDALAAAAIVSNVQEALGHSAALSRFFWPSANGGYLAAARGRKLRGVFTIDDNSPLRLRGLRNAFEHFDENLDKFLLDERYGYFFPDPMVSEHEIADEEGGHIFKLVDTKRSICVLLGAKFEFQPVRVEVGRVLQRAREMVPVPKRR